MIDNIKYAISMVRKKDKALVYMLIASTLTEMFLPLIGIYFPKFVVEQIGLDITVITLIVRIILFTSVIAFVYFICKYLSTRITWKLITVQAEYIWDIYMKSISCNYRIMESAKGQTLYQRAKNSLSQGDNSCIRIIIPALLNILVGVLGTIVYIVILCRLNYLIVFFLTLISLCGIVLSTYSINYEQKNKNKWANIDKELNYVINKCADSYYGKDIRLYRMQGWLLGLKDKLIEKRAYWYKKVENKRMLALLGNVFVMFIREGFAYIYLIIKVSRSEISIADFVFYMGVIAGFSQWISKIVNELSRVKVGSCLVSDYRMFIECDNYDTENNTKQYRELDKQNVKIEFKNVCFFYDNTQTNVINNLSFVINPGEKIGFVGVNGAGKTTVVKLICGLYKPTQGQILINDSPIQDYKYEDIVSLYSTVFQDSCVFPFTVAENIAMKKEGDYDRNKVERCIKKSGLFERIDKAYKKADSEVLKVITDKGLMLSGGQLQKMYLARALYKDGGVLILDEPTAALDPVAEREQYLKYNDFSKGKTSIYISHRLASTSFCDYIAFFENGTIVEWGTHDELIKMDGKYAEMFKVQSQYYKEKDGVLE